MIFTPRIEGSASIRASVPDFLQGFRGRVESGLLSGRPHARSNYIVTSAEADRLQVTAADWRTAFNVGLNEIELRALQPGLVGYCVEYKRWAGYALALGAAIAVPMIGVMLSIDLDAYIQAHPISMFPNFSVQHQVRVVWGMVAFWGFVWPWLLIAFHKRPVKRLLERIVSEVDATAVERPR